MVFAPGGIEEAEGPMGKEIEKSVGGVVPILILALNEQFGIGGGQCAGRPG